MADLTLTVDVSSVTNAERKLKSFKTAANDISVNKLSAGINTLQSNVKKLVQARREGSITEKTYRTGLLENKRAYEAVGVSTQKATAEVHKYAKSIEISLNAIRESKAATQAEAAALREYSQARRSASEENARYNTISKASLQVEQQALKTVKVQKEANRRLRMEFKEGYAAKVQLRAAQMGLNKARRQGIITEAEYARSMSRLGDVTTQSSKHMSRMGVAMQQTGYQVGDFLVQIQGGQNPLVAFGQQATQLVGVLYLLPAATLAGTVAIAGLTVSVGLLIASLGIMIPLVTAIGAAWLRTRDKADKAKEGLNSWEEALKSARVESSRLKQEIDLINSGLETMSQKTFTDAVTKASEAVVVAQDRLKKLLDPSVPTSSKPLRDARNTLYIAQEALKVAKEELQVYNDRLKLTEDNNAKDDFNKRAEAGNETVASMQTQLELQREIYRFGSASVEVARKRAQQEALSSNLTAEQTEEYIKLALEIREVEGNIDKLKRNQDLISTGADILKGVWENLKKVVSDAADEAGRFSDNLVLGQEFLAASVKSGVASGAIPPQALEDLPQTDAERAWERLLENRRRKARKDKEGEPTRGGRASGNTAEGFLTNLQRELDLRESLIGLSEKERSVASEVHRLRQQVLDKGYEISEERLESYVREKQALNERLQLEQDIQSSISNGLMDIITQTQSVEDAFKQMMFNIIESIYQQKIATPLSEGILSLFMANGGAFNKGVQMFADGGVVNSPTGFRHSGGLGVMGEAGPEAIMPLKRGSNGQLGVQANGGGGGTTVVQVQLSPELIGGILAEAESQSVKVVSQAAGGIVKRSVSAVVEQRRKGGPMKAAFG